MIRGWEALWIDGKMVERVIGKKPVTDSTAQSLTAGRADKQVGFGLGATMGASIFATNTLH